MSQAVAKASGYIRASRYESGTAQDCMTLQTAAGLTPEGRVDHPVFFRGTVVRPDVAAAGLRMLAEIAYTRYFNPMPGRGSLDPILTANGDRLRCEAFSACNGVYARLDLLSESFDNASLGLGTTNIDINPPLAQALAGVRPRHRLHLNVGPDQVEMTPASDIHVERKVDLPERWVRALAETQSIAPTLESRARFNAVGWQRFLNALPMVGGSGSGPSMWLLPGTNGLRQTARPARGAISLAGTARLSAVKRLQHLVQDAHVYGPSIEADTPHAVSAWEFTLPGARVLLMLSPEPYRGFSGEGTVLPALTQACAADAITLQALLAWEATIDSTALAAETGFDAGRIHRALQYLATSGHLGFDLHERCYFHRQLPFVESRLEQNYPRLAAARALVAAGAITHEQAHLRIASDDHFQWVGFEGGTPHCTCLFWTRYRGTRGPCKHILAAQLYLEK